MFHSMWTGCVERAFGGSEERGAAAVGGPVDSTAQLPHAERYADDDARPY